MGKSILFTSMVLVVLLIFTISCVSKEVQVTETYYETEYETEYKTETYTETEDVLLKTVENSNLLSADTKWRSAWLRLVDGAGKATHYYGYNISAEEYSKSQIQVTFNLPPQLHEGLIYAVDLEGSCTDPSLKYGGLLFDRSYVSEGECHIASPESTLSISRSLSSRKVTLVPS